ncbi:hypothetical protein HDU98_003845, partial [Podochytrium sp. JEL0797]
DESFMPMSIACSNVIRWINKHDEKMGVTTKSGALEDIQYLLMAVLAVLMAYLALGYLQPMVKA